MRILLVDDDDGLRECYRLMLESLNHTVLEASTGHDAEVKLCDGVDAVICDAHFAWHAGNRQGPHGPELLATARNLGVIGVLISGDDELVEYARRRGFAAFTKPPEMTKVLAALEPAGAAA